MKRDDPQAQIDAAELRILQALLKRGQEAHKRAVVMVLTFLPAALIIAAVTAVSDIGPLFYVFAALFLIAGIRSWMNMRDMDNFITTVQNDIKEKTR